MQNNKLIMARNNCKFTQKELAKMIGISVRQYQRLEYGESEGSLKIWKKISKFLNVSIENLIP